MNSDSGPSSASSGMMSSNQRKERGAIAAQACETCRSRKQRCDETRPRCGLCQKMNLECHYREPQPTKKDKTLVEILERLRSLEVKVDRIPLRPPASSSSFAPTHSSPSSQSMFANPIQSPYTSSPLRPPHASSPSGSLGRSQPYRHASAAHKMLTWPAIQQLLLSALPSNLADLQSLESEGSAFIVRMQKGTPTLPNDDALNFRPFVGMQTQATRTVNGARVTFPDLTQEVMSRLATQYFDTFNLLYPFMDRQIFMSDTLSKVNSEGFNGDNDSVIALLVFALGELAHEASQGLPMNFDNGRASGLRGGTFERPPGLTLFNEARKRMGFVLTACDLENVQIFSLAALYYESCSRHVDFWRLSVSASLACQVLITCNEIDFNSHRGDLIKRAFWHCAIMETGLHLELDLPLTGIVGLEDRVGLPQFNGPFCEADHRGNQSSNFEAHFASQIALRRLCANLHNNINDSMDSSDTYSSTNEDFSGPTASTLWMLASQLDQWRSLLPRELQWPEDDPAAFPGTRSSNAHGYSQPLDPNLSTPYPARQGSSFFTADLDREPHFYPYAYDIQTALLRTRYYYARYMVYRPFVYKALHFADQMTQDDAKGVSECLKACIKWPLTLSPASRHKRLIPYLFCWSQNFLGILLILHLSQHTPVLRRIRSQMCGPTFDADVDQSIGLMLDWIKDLKSSDPIALWCFNILRTIYQIE